VTDEIILLVLGRISYPGFSFVLGYKGGEPFLQIECSGHCNVSGVPLVWKSRKWLLSRHMTVSEIVQTAFKATLTAIEHEARENFRYRNVAIFGPHFNVERMVTLASDASATDERVEMGA
jgi:hypothetical protein